MQSVHVSSQQQTLQEHFTLIQSKSKGKGKAPPKPAIFFNLGSRWGWLDNATSRGKRTSTHCIRGWVGSRTGLDGYDKSRPRPDSIPEPSDPPLSQAYSLIMRQMTHVKENLE
jgi:hypothetical protein